MDGDQNTGDSRAQSYRFRVQGRVQGVGFRQSCAARAAELGVAGWVRNCDNGDVEGCACACASEAELQQFRNWLTQGPRWAQVVALDWQPAEAPAEEFSGFEVRR